MPHPSLIDVVSGSVATGAYVGEELLPFCSEYRSDPATVGSHARSEKIGHESVGHLEAETSKPNAVPTECSVRLMINFWRCCEDQAVTKWPTLMKSSDCSRGHYVSGLLLTFKLIA